MNPLRFEDIKPLTGEELLRYRAERHKALGQLIREASQEARENYAQRLLKQSGLGERFEMRTFGTFRVNPGSEAAFKAALDVYLARTDRVGFAGPWGVGKTHLLAAITRACGESGTPAYFTTGINLLDRIRKSYDNKGDVKHGEPDIVTHYARIPILCLDDLGKERFTPWAAERLYALINARYEQNLGLCTSSNYTARELAEYWTSAGLDKTMGVALVDRIREMTGEWVALTGRSQRG